MRTKYSYMTDAELLRLFDHKRTQSPIIDELCNRIHRSTALSTGGMFGQVIPEAHKCPVCEATLENGK